MSGGGATTPGRSLPSPVMLVPMPTAAPAFSAAATLMNEIVERGALGLGQCGMEALVGRPDRARLQARRQRLPPRAPVVSSPASAPSAQAATRLSLLSRSMAAKRDQAAAEGLVEFVTNPAHKRSQLVRLTQKGDKRTPR